MDHAAVRLAEIAGDIAADFLLADLLERADLLVRQHKVVVDVVADFGLREGVHTERLGVSGEAIVFDIPREVNEEDEFFPASRPT